MRQLSLMLRWFLSLLSICASCLAGYGMDRMEIVRELLRECHRNQLSSVIPPPYPEALTKLKQMRPEKELLQLYEQRDPVVLCTIEYDPKKIRYEGGSE